MVARLQPPQNKPKTLNTLVLRFDGKSQQDCVNYPKRKKL